MSTSFAGDSSSGINRGDIDIGPTTVTEFLKDLRHKLDEWLNEAKESLSLSGPICTDANSLLSNTRLRLERASVLWAQTQYLKTAINGQVDTLRKIYESSRKQIRKNKKAFEKSLKQLDKQDARLQNALKVLEECVLDRAIEEDNELVRRRLEILEQKQTSGNEENDNFANLSDSTDKELMKKIQESEIKPRNLKGFVDDDAIAQLRISTTEAIDFIQQTIADSEEMLNRLGVSISEFSSQDWTSDLKMPAGLLTSNDDKPQQMQADIAAAGENSKSKPKANNSPERGNTVDPNKWKSAIKRGLEGAHNQTTQIATHAHAMAMLLESLARHYDQCSQAIHLLDSVEGVDSVVSSNTKDVTAGRDSAHIQSRIERGEYNKEQLEDLEDLAVVLSTDSTELSSVLTELQERHTEIAELSNIVCEFQTDVCELVYSRAKKAFEALEAFGVEIEMLVEELELCKERIQADSIEDPSDSLEKPKGDTNTKPEEYQKGDRDNDNEPSRQNLNTIGINACMREMESLVEYYTLFHVSYQRLIMEVRRRQLFRLQMQNVVDDMAVRVGKMITEELQERKEVFESVADYLPGDLWPGLVEGPPFVEISKGGNWVLPEISVDSVNTAKQVLASLEQRMISGSVESNQTVKGKR